MIEKTEILRRRDMREVFTFTIDPADAKDFDDAISFQEIEESSESYSSKPSCPGLRLRVPNTLRTLSTEYIPNADDKDTSIKENGTKVYQIGVHIADVSFYVKPGTKVDEDAYKRGTSVYLVDRVIPMLPEELCNDKCSLRPGEDKLCMSVVFTMNEKAEVLKYKICRTVIQSNMRLNYEEAQEIMDEGMNGLMDEGMNGLMDERMNGLMDEGMNGLMGEGMNGLMDEGETSRARDLEISRVIIILNGLAQKLREERIANGALTIEQEEMRFRLDGQGNPVEIYFEQPNEAHHLIEEFMLLANKTVAKAVGSGRPFVYRVHDLPDGEKLDAVKRFAKRVGSEWYSSKPSCPGLRLRVPNTLRTLSTEYIPNADNDSEESSRRREEGIKRAIEMLTIRAQAKAVYSTYNIGHYGLAFSHYTHFTSPIRRYPDLMVHRLVEKYILTGKPISLTREELEAKCEHCSACEQEATQAERDSIKLYQAMWMTGHVGEVLDGHISAVTDFGLFVQLDESRCEGLVHISKIGKEGEYWQYDAENYRLVCEKRKSYGLGDKVRVKVVKADVNKAQIDFELVG